MRKRTIDETCFPHRSLEQRRWASISVVQNKRACSIRNFQGWTVQNRVYPGVGILFDICNHTEMYIEHSSMVRQGIEPCFKHTPAWSGRVFAHQIPRLLLEIPQFQPVYPTEQTLSRWEFQAAYGNKDRRNTLDSCHLHRARAGHLWNWRFFISSSVPTILRGPNDQLSRRSESWKEKKKEDLRPERKYRRQVVRDIYAYDHGLERSDQCAEIIIWCCKL